MVGGNTVKSTGGMNAADTQWQDSYDFTREAGILATLKSAEAYPSLAELAAAVQKEYEDWKAAGAEGYFDSVNLFMLDTMVGGHGINNLELVKVLAENSAAGIDWLESVGGTVSVIRGVTTRTVSGGTEDTAWRDLSSIRVVDDVIPGLRGALRARFRQSKNTEQSRGAIRAQVVLELENKLAREIITGYDGVTVTADSEDPTRCLVDFSFAVAHGLNQIWLTAHVTV